MRLPASRGTSSGVDDGVIPMINIVFLLLVFFMVAGTIQPPDPIDTRPPSSERDGEMPSASRVLHLGADGTLALDGERLILSELTMAVSVTEPTEPYVSIDEPGVSMDETGDDPLALRADANVPFALLRDTIDALRAAGVRQVELITDPAASVDP